jgi:hypothetical protein
MKQGVASGLLDLWLLCSLVQPTWIRSGDDPSGAVLL